MLKKDYIRFLLKKIVRDKTYDSLDEQGVLYGEKTIINNPGKWSFNLKRKLIEESYEVLKTKSKKELSEELSDVFDIFNEILKANHISLSDVLEISLKKSQERGSFQNKYFLNYIDVPKDHDLVEAYRKSGAREVEITEDKVESAPK